MTDLPTSPFAGHSELAGLDEAWRQGFKAGRGEWEATIERCEHGKIDRHPYSYVAYVARDLTDDDWCPGAAAGEETNHD